MDTPYRLKSLLEDIVKLLGSNIPCVLAFELTKEREKFYRGNAQNIFNHVGKENLKGEFVLIISNEK
jgi:16S rRNA (cytidine1402-2'-O)-methyltransferase